MSASHLRAIAASLEQIAEDVTAWDTSTVIPCGSRLPEALQGAATPMLAAGFCSCSADLMAAAAILTEAAGDARGRACEIEAAEAAAAAAEAAGPVDDEPHDDGPPYVLPLF